jgi:transposase
MMLDLKGGHGKYCEPRFAVPPWTRETPEWKKIDAELDVSHPARRLVDAMALLDLQPLFACYSAGGSDALPPDLMLRIVLIEMWSGRGRPSQWFKDASENTPLRWASFGVRPSRSACYKFRDRLGSVIDQLFKAVLDLAVTEEITPGRRVALDGSFLAANASRHQLLNEERLDKRQQELATICEGDAKGDIPEKTPGWMAKTPSTRTKQATRYQRAKVRLDEFHATNRRQNPARRRPAKKIVVSATDSESALGLDKEKVFRPLYNVQLMKDLDSLLTLNYDVFAQNSDCGTLGPMLQRGRDLFGLLLSDVTCDATYVTACNLAICARQQVTLCGPWQTNDYSQKAKKKKESPMISKDAFTWVPEENQYRCPEGNPLTWIGKNRRKQADGEINIQHSFRCSPEKCQACQRKESCAKNPARGRSVKRSEHEDLVDAHRIHMETPQAKALYRLRKQTVELQYADMKQNRNLRRLSGRGLARTRIEVGLTELVYNLVIVERVLRNRKDARQATENTCAVAC